MKILPLLIFSLLAFDIQAQDTTANSLFTKAYLEFERDIKIPIKLERISNKLRIWKENLGPDWQTGWPQFQKTILGLEKEQKATINILHDLKNTMLMAQKTQEESAFKGYVLEDKKFKKKYSNLWDRIKKLARERGRQEAREQFHSTGGLVLFDAAINIVRSCDPNETRENRKKAMEILEGYAERSGGYPLSDNFFGRAFFADHINRARSWLSKNDPLFSTVLDGKSAEEFLKAVFGDEDGSEIQSIAAYTEQRDLLAKSGWKAIQKCEDPAIVAARELVILMHENIKLGEELDKKEEVLRRDLGNAFFEIYGIEVNFYF